MQLLLVVPGLCALPEAKLAGCAPLAALAAHATSTIVGEGLDAATLEALQLDAPPAPIAALGSGLRIGRDYVLRADPVALVAGHDDVRLVGRVDDLSTDEADALRATLNTHFAVDGIAFAMPRPDTWFARLHEPPDIVTTPLPLAIDRPLAPLLPRGLGGGAWRRWQNEIQMLLHEHPVNAARTARGDVAVAGVWFWGGGVAPTTAALPGLAVFSGGGRDGDLLRGLARAGGGRKAPLPSSLATLKFADEPGKQIAVMLPTPPDDEALAAFARSWLGPALVRLYRGELRVLQLLADGAPCGAIVWSATRPTTLARWRARIAPRPFRLPPEPPPT